ncbi:MAG: NUDIX hydrolase [Planctomycetota bacterium]|jgi:8-oxo-dGTP pyrophosphatase MutT (NUDIX family)
MTAARCIRLRRPPTLQLTEGPFVPEGRDVLDEIEQRWRRLCAANDAYFDGRLLHVLGVHRNGCGGAVLHVVEAAYRFHAVQDASFDVGCRPLGVKGVTTRDGRVLLGLRSATVNGYPGCWEFAPGGCVDPGSDPADRLVAELGEETGLAPAAPPVADALVYDPVIRCWEIVYRLAAAAGEPVPAPGEYDELRWCDAGDWPCPLSPVAGQIAEIV